MVLALVWVAAAPAIAGVPTGFTVSQFVSGFARPSAMAFAPDGRLFVCEQAGGVRVVKNGELLRTPFVTVSVDPDGERGLGGIVFDPDFTTNGWVYLYYTTRENPKHNRIVRFTANGDTAVPGSETLIMEMSPLGEAKFHNGGAMHFGIDGKLYVTVGENYVGANAQNLNITHGKVLRINKDGSIPTDNPFYDVASGKGKAIWVMGLRNPWTMAIQPDTGRMFINDVGQNMVEEINDGVAGANYGWPETEGPTTNPQYRTPLYSYVHSAGQGGSCAITGGTFYQPSVQSFPAEYVGKYFFLDHCGGWIKYIDPNNPSAAQTLATPGTATFPVYLLVGPDGALYYLDRGPNALYRIQYSASNAPQITMQPTDQTVTVGQAATFRATAAGSAPLSFEWQRNGVTIPGATSASYTVSSPQTADQGAQFRVVVRNSFGNATSNPAYLNVTTNQAPTASIATPLSTTTYVAGDMISYSGSASDPEQGNLPASALTWRVDLHHNVHSHPFVPDTIGAGGTFTVPVVGETDHDVWLRIYLTAKDSGGRSNTTYRDIFPRKSVMTFRTNPAGLKIALDGAPIADGSAITGVIGVQRALGVPSPQTLGGVQYEFVSWTHGGAVTQTIATPASNTTFTANFRVVSTGGGGGGLGAHWTLDEVSGTTAADSSGNNNTGMLLNGPQWATGRIGGALSLDGQNDYVRVPDAPGLRTNDFTVALWFRPTNTGGSRTLISKPTGTTWDNSYVVYIDGGWLRFHTCCNSGIATLGQVSPNTWYHVAAAKTGTKVQLYLNGTPVAVINNAPATVSYNARSLFLGAEDDNNDEQGENFFAGLLDDVRIYPRGLAATEVSALYAGSSSTDTTAPTVAITAPAGNATVAGLTSIAATATDNVGIVGVQFRLDGAALGVEDTSAPYGVSWDTTTASNSTHTLTAVARDAAGNTKSVSVSVTVNNVGPADTTDPSKPAGLIATAVSSTQVNLSWSASTDDVGVTGYRIYRDGAIIGTTAALTYASTGLTASTAYSFRVAAYDAAGNLSLQSSVADVTTPAPPTGGSGLVGQWRFEEGSGVMADSGGTGLTASLVNSPAWVTGRYGKGLSFNGSNQHAVVPDAAALDVTRITIAAWVYKTRGDLSDWGMIAHRAAGNSWQDRWALFYNNSGGDEYGFLVKTDSGQATANGPSSGADLNQWVHLVGTYDGTQVRLYRNGVLIASAPLTGNIPAETNPLSFGAGTNDGGRTYGERFQGLLDEVSLYNRALTASEVAALYSSTLTPAP